MTETGTSATKIMGCEMVNADSLGISPYRIPDNVGCHSSSQPRSVFRNSPEYFAFRHSCIAEPGIDQILTPIRHRYRSQPPAFANQIDDDPMVFSQLQLIQSQVHGLRSPQTAPEQQSNQRCIPPAAQRASRDSI